MLWKVGLKEQRERKNKSKVTQELVKKKKYSRITNKKRNESLTQMKKEGKQQGKRIGETGRAKLI